MFEERFPWRGSTPLDTAAAATDLLGSDGKCCLFQGLICGGGAGTNRARFCLLFASWCNGYCLRCRDPSACTYRGHSVLEAYLVQWLLPPLPGSERLHVPRTFRTGGRMGSPTITAFCRRFFCVLEAGPGLPHNYSILPEILLLYPGIRTTGGISRTSHIVQCSENSCWSRDPTPGTS
ncbi:hypothetical protein QE152_g37227 [Popillia japonica]|uniref:Uncharacterized protein n=1 Tax=Popillia japonica TaxID=7064 RepID=A0AAW1IAU8_POPJA